MTDPYPSQLKKAVKAYFRSNRGIKVISKIYGIDQKYIIKKIKERPPIYYNYIH